MFSLLLPLTSDSHATTSHFLVQICTSLINPDLLSRNSSASALSATMSKTMINRQCPSEIDTKEDDTMSTITIQTLPLQHAYPGLYSSRSEGLRWGLLEPIAYHVHLRRRPHDRYCIPGYGCCKSRHLPAVRTNNLGQILALIESPTLMETLLLDFAD